MISRWGTTSNDRIQEHQGWFIGTRLFTCSDGTSFWQCKWSKTMWSFNDPTATIYGWQSKKSKRHKKDFQSREEAFDFAAQYVKELDEKRLST